MGAKLCADLYYSGKISRQEANYLLTFCNNPSPAFLVSYVCGICLEGKAKICTVLVLLMTSNLVCMIFFRIYFSFKKDKNVFCICVESPSESSEGYNIDMAIMNGFETITRLGGYILLFSAFSDLFSAQAQSRAAGKLRQTSYYMVSDQLWGPYRFVKDYTLLPDDCTDPDQRLQYANRLLRKDNCWYLMGTVWSDAGDYLSDPTEVVFDPVQKRLIRKS